MKPKYIFIVVAVLALIGVGVMMQKLKSDVENPVVNTDTTSTTNTKEPEPIIVKDFEGEANPDVMTLFITTWRWISTTSNDGKNITPKQADKFNLTFQKNGNFTSTTDCNNIQGKYKVNNKQIIFSDMISTEMYCANSQENDYRKIFEDAASYHFTTKGELVFDLKLGSGSATFR